MWKILEAVKAEFEKFAEHLDKVDKQLNTASKSLNDLRHTRTNVMSRKLKDINALENEESRDILNLPQNTPPANEFDNKENPEKKDA